MFLFLIDPDLSFSLFLICSYFLAQSELQCSYKVCSYKKKQSVVRYYEILSNYYLKVFHYELTIYDHNKDPNLRNMVRSLGFASPQYPSFNKTLVTFIF